MSEWLDLMLDEIARKRREAIAAREETERRKKKARTEKDLMTIRKSRHLNRSSAKTPRAMTTYRQVGLR